MITYIVFIILGLFLLGYILERRKTSSKYLRNLPGPKPLPFLGNTLSGIGGTKVYLPLIDRWLKEHGDTIIVHDGAFSIAIMTIDYGLTEYIYSSTVHIEKPPQYKFFSGWLGEGLLTSTGLKWRSHRKAITPSFHFAILQKFISIFDRAGNDLLKTLEKEIDKDNVEISKIISLYTLDVICDAAMGLKITDTNESYTKYIKYIKDMCSIIISRVATPIHPIFYSITWSAFKETKALKYIHKFVDDVTNSKIKELEKEPCTNKTNFDDYGKKERLAFLDLLLRTKINDKSLDKIDLRDEVNTFMFEGHDTTSSAVSFCLYSLSIYPEIQQKVFDEQCRLFGKNVKEAVPSYADLSNMKYLELVIKETLRLYPSVPFIGRTLARDLEYNGTIYPKGVNILLYTFGMHRNEKYFPNPDEFIPERFESVDGKLPYTYTPFSAGPRNCIGQKFAMLELLSTISKVVRNFVLKPSIPKHKLVLAPELILISKTGVRVSLSKRTKHII